MLNCGSPTSTVHRHDDPHQWDNVGPRRAKTGDCPSTGISLLITRDYTMQTIRGSFNTVQGSAGGEGAIDTFSQITKVSQRVGVESIPPSLRNGLNPNDQMSKPVAGQVNRANRSAGRKANKDTLADTHRGSSTTTVHVHEMDQDSRLLHNHPVVNHQQREARRGEGDVKRDLRRVERRLRHVEGRLKRVNRRIRRMEVDESRDDGSKDVS